MKNQDWVERQPNQDKLKCAIAEHWGRAGDKQIGMCINVTKAEIDNELPGNQQEHNRQQPRRH